MDKFGNKYFENLEEELPCKAWSRQDSSAETDIHEKYGRDGWITKTRNSIRTWFEQSYIMATVSLTV